MSDESTIQRIKQFGYTALQFRFIRLVAMHSGVFLRRQYLQYAGARYESLYQDWKDRTANDKRSAGTLKAYSSRGHFLPYRIYVDPRTFMVTIKEPTSDKPAKSRFHLLVPPLCHQDTFASEEKLGS